MTGDSPATKLRRGIGLPAAAALVVSGTLGVGIFLTPAGMARLLASPGRRLAALRSFLEAGASRAA